MSTVYCGFFPRWQGQCPQCETWNSLTEEQFSKTSSKIKLPSFAKPQRKTPVLLKDVSVDSMGFMSTGITELDRVFGSGIIRGSVTLLGGEPGIGKSTLALQVAQNLSAQKGLTVLYVSAEESEGQLYLRSQRIGVNDTALYVFSELDILKIMKAIDQLNPDLVILDSIQVVHHPGVSSVSGSVAQVRQCAQELIQMAKNRQMALFLIGHITKEGGLAGPKVLEHMVDVILFFEGERHQRYRLLRCFKNRYSNTHEVGIFEMTKQGLQEVTQASELFVEGRTLDAPGSVVVAVSEGSRVILIEIQALVVDSGFGHAKRTFLGVDANRANLMVATMEKILGLRMSTKDIILNIVGGLNVREPALDLGVVLAMLSSLRECVVGSKIGVIGEVGLTGEVRMVPNVDRRLQEFAKLGFRSVYVPGACQVAAKSLNVIPVSSIGVMMDHFLSGE